MNQLKYLNNFKEWNIQQQKITWMTGLLEDFFIKYFFKSFFQVSSYFNLSWFGLCWKSEGNRWIIKRLDWRRYSIYCQGGEDNWLKADISWDFILKTVFIPLDNCSQPLSSKPIRRGNLSKRGEMDGFFWGLAGLR